jgi:hypothetical protein
MRTTSRSLPVNAETRRLATIRSPEAGATAGRPVAVVVDHVADSYEYLAGWIRQLVAGRAAQGVRRG